MLARERNIFSPVIEIGEEKRERSKKLPSKLARDDQMKARKSKENFTSVDPTYLTVRQERER